MDDIFGWRFVGALAFGIGVCIALAKMFLPNTRLANRVRPYTAASRSLLGRLPDRTAILGSTANMGAISVVQRLYRPVGEALLVFLGRILGHAWDDRATLVRLRQADLLTDVDESNRVHEWRLRQIAAALKWGLGLGIAAQLLKQTPILSLLAFVLGVVIGVSRHNALISSTIEHRRTRMRIELYTINQLLAIYLRTSGSPTLAAQRLVRRARGAIIDELDEALRLHARGMPASQAFGRIATTTPEPLASRTYKLLSSGSERGADLAKALLSLSEDVRDQRRNEVRRSATKRQGAMLIPILMFLAPVMLLFIAAPLPTFFLGN